MSTDTTRWRRVRGLIETAMDLAGDERVRFLDTACAGDPALRTEAEALLAQDARTGGLEPSPSLPTPEPSAAPGRRIGAFALVREIGSGGMGKVYLAEREDGGFRQRVAIKVIKRGMDTDDILRRFKLERQLLAGLEHPNIARLYDGGATDDGLPYLALEFVDGIAIDRWCDEHRSTVRERIELFLCVCSAVHHAHQNLVVHRDLKPSNILVTSAGVPKLVDFGIAKVLLPEGAEHAVERTSTEQRLLTPAYASPEQLRGDPITTASDVFSLGVVLYELLAGTKPFRPEDRVPGATGSRTAERPSTVLRTADRAGKIGAARRIDATSLRRMLSGDLDTIVLAALQDDPARRYPSVDQLASDLRRHLDGLPVSARPDSWSYRASKFVRRNKVLVGAGVVLVIALVGGFAVSTVLSFQAVHARDAETLQRRIAERRFADVRELATKFIFEVHTAIEPLHGSLPARQLIIRTATDFLERLAREEKDDASLQLQLAQSWMRIGEIQSSRGTASVGNTGAALKSYERTRVIAQDLFRVDPTNGVKGHLLLRSQIRIAEMLLGLQRLPEARDLCLQTLASCEQLVAANPGDRTLERERVHDHTRLAEVLRALGEHEDCLVHYRASVALSEDLARAWAGDDDIQASLGAAIQRLGEFLDQELHYDEALAEEERALAIYVRIVQRHPERADWRREVAVCRHFLARIENHQGCDDEACGESRASLESFLSLSRGDEMNYSARADAASSLSQHGSLLLAAGQPSEAVPCCRASLELFDDLVRRDPENLEVRRNLAMAGGCLARSLLHSGDDEEAVRVFRESRGEFEEISGASPGDHAVRNDSCLNDGVFGQACLAAAEEPGAGPACRLRRLREAHAWLLSGIGGLRELQAEDHATQAAQALLPTFEKGLAQSRSRLLEAGEGVDSGAPDPPDSKEGQRPPPRNTRNP